MRQEAGTHIASLAIGQRLSAVARRIPPGSVIVDVGTDHGLLLISLLKQGVASKAIGIEVTERSIAKARANADDFDASLDLRVGYGLDPVAPGEVGVIVLSGIGGETIVDVLARGAAVVREASIIITQPMKDAAQLVRWAHESGLILLGDDVVRDRAWMYRVLTFRAGAAFMPSEWNAAETGIEYEVTPTMLKNDRALLIRYLGRRLRIRRQVRELKCRIHPVKDTQEDSTLTAMEAVIAKLDGEC
jgi:tRNA (adenine22-N1)-methyltransferase